MRNARRHLSTIGIVGLFVGLVLTLIPGGQAQAAPSAKVGPGTAIKIGNGACTLAAAGTDNGGRLVGLTAGHCGRIGAPVTLENNRRAGVVGRIADRNVGLDYAVIAFDRAKVVPVRRIGQSTVRRTAAFPGPGAAVCKDGRTTGFSCGVVLGRFDGRRNETLSYVCAAPGDSGGPILAGDRLVGILTGGAGVSIPGTDIGVLIECVHPALPIYTPMIATKITPILHDLRLNGRVGAGFRPV